MWYMYHVLERMFICTDKWLMHTCIVLNASFQQTLSQNKIEQLQAHEQNYLANETRHTKINP